MTPRRIPTLTAILSLILIAGVAFSGCNANAETSPTPTLAPTATATSQPTATPLPGTVWFVSPEPLDSGLGSLVDAYLQQAASQAGLQYQALPEFKQGDVPQKLAVAVFLDPAEDLSGYAANMPGTQFVLIGNNLPQASGNMSVVDTQLDQQLFVAGYIATLVAPDFRSGGLFDAADPLLAEKEDTFQNGAAYLCGRCVPVYTPLVLFPQVATFQTGADASALKSVFDQLNLNRIQTLYLPSAAMDADFMAYLGGLNVQMLGLQPPSDEFRTNWISTVGVDVVSALDQVWPMILNGEGGQQVTAAVVLQDVNPSWLTPGKEAMVDSVIQDLAGGWISPRSVE